MERCAAEEIGEGKPHGRRRRQRQRQRRRRSPSPGQPYDYIVLQGGDRFYIPEDEDKEEWVQFFEQSARATREVIALDGNGRPADGINRAAILDNSSHRDGSIYTVSGDWHRSYRIVDTNETQREAMALSEPSNCCPDRETCIFHFASAMMQIFSVKLGKIIHHDGPIQIYGYIAVRDLLDPLRNYIFNRSRDDPITIDQGSLIEMTGPKRGIDMKSAVLIEYDMKIKKGEQEVDDLQLIDGVSYFGEVTTPTFLPFLSRIDGAGGAVDITVAMLREAVEATIEVDIMQVDGSGFDLLLTGFISGMRVGHEKEIHLFRGVVREACKLRRLVVAVVEDTLMHLKFKIVDERGDLASEVECNASFKSSLHGNASQQIKLNQIPITVKVTWSAL